MAESGELRVWGLTFADIEKLKREHRQTRFALQSIAFGTFGKGPCRDIRSARRVAIRSLVKQAAPHVPNDVEVEDG